MPSMNRQWRSLEELAGDPQFVARASQEFPTLAAALQVPHDRRRVLKLMAAGMALLGLAGCDDGEPGGNLIPPVRPPPATVSRGSHLFATASVLGGYASGVLVRHDVGRPIKVEGNPDHPASLGGTDAFAQAEILGFYDPDRAGGITQDGNPTDRQSLLTALAAQRATLLQTKGEGFRILTGATTSPTLLRQLAELRQRYPALRWHQWEPVSRDAPHDGAVRAFGSALEIVPKLGSADVVLALDSDLLSSAPGHVRLARDFAQRRNPARNPVMSRLYAVEPTPTLTGVAADQRIIASPRDLHRGVLALAEVLLHGAPSADAPPWVAPIAADLQAHHGRAFVHLGPHHPPALHALVHAMNESLGGRGATYNLIAPVVSTAAPLQELVSDMQAGRVTSLLILDSNPVFTAPATLGFADAMHRVPFSMALTIEPNETSSAVHWALPQRHPYEDWSDARAFDGTAGILQPQAQPLFGGISPHHLLALLSDPVAPDARDLVQQTWQAQLGDDAARGWHDALASGTVAHSAGQPVTTALRGDVASQRPAPPPVQPLTLLLRPDPHLWDGRFANNAWLQELPRPLTKLTWDNPLLISPAQGRRLGVDNGDRIVLSAGAAELTLPAWVVPGQADDCAVALLGFGRRVVGTVGEGTGFDLYPLTGRTEAPSLRKGEGRQLLASTEHHNPLEARGNDFARHATLAAFQADPHLLGDPAHTPSLYRWKPSGPAEWGMSIDLNACIGCNACVVACMAENNIPVVGRQEVIREREMHWLRIDRYYDGDSNDPKMLFQPVLCMHCEQAPCEIVCPVGATVHDHEGLNVMVYNRCVGTRFCSNNCPYKVRRFNYFAFAQEEHRPAVARNPEVTVRARGVMEKCTFCLQRIAAARITADIADRPVGGNEVRTACQSACPTQAISFGNMAQPDAEVLARKRSPLSYALLADQNTHPRVTYEGRIDNPPDTAAQGKGA
jgi:molybdopterin-containing oxidoreductase family iron-sulfur binding subunit